MAVILEKDALLWIQLPKAKILTEGRYLSSDAKSVSVEVLQTGSLEQLTWDQVKPMHQSSIDGVEDMIQLSDLHEGSILRNMNIRYQKDLIYTYTGSILVAVNPFKNLDIYNQNTILKYQGARLGEQPPHIFAIAAEAYYSLFKTTPPSNQCAVISGESGAGKTESTKLILSYLAHLSGGHSQVEEQLLDSSPILEAFGNAKTTRNNNSSRFGKFMEIHFNGQGHIEGASINDFLLEKIRIVQQAAEERNYHIFYDLLAGATKAQKKDWKLTKPQDYKYLNGSGCYEAKGIVDEDDFEHVKTAMENMNFSEEKIDNILQIVAAVLHIGNISFQKKDEDAIALQGKEASEIAAKLLGVGAEDLSFGLMHRVSVTRGERIVQPLTMSKACDSREALAKAIYGWLFKAIVQMLNDSIAKIHSNIFIGVLDIFGFEDFKVNSFEQFCINYANERLQQFFNQHIFKLEQEVYTKEQIKWDHIEFVDNQPCLDLISKKPTGILRILDEECNFPKATDSTFLEKLHSNHKTNKYYIVPKLAKTNFLVKHYAGDVSYEVDGFLEKNRDRLRDDLEDIVRKSEFAFLKYCMSVAQPSADSKAGKARVDSVGGNFHESLNSLMSTLSSCNPYFVRCVKPNMKQGPDEFDKDLVEAQLRYSGLLETVRIRKAGYPVRMSFKLFYMRYWMVIGKARDEKDFKKAAEKIMRTLSLEPGNLAYQLGTTKIFLKDNIDNQLEKRRAGVLSTFVVIIQRYARCYLLRKQFRNIRRAIRKIQRVFRGHRARQRVRKIRKAMATLQKFGKLCIPRIRYLNLRKHVLTIQTAARLRVVVDVLQARERALRKQQANRLQAYKEASEKYEVAAAAAKAAYSAALRDADQKNEEAIRQAQEAAAAAAAQATAKAASAAHAAAEKAAAEDSMRQEAKAKVEETPEAPADASARTFARFALVHFQDGQTDSFLDEPLSGSLLTLPESIQHDAPTLSRMIMAYMDDYPLQRLPKSEMLRIILEKGIYQAGLREEILCQLIKQTTKNPRDVSRQRGFKLLCAIMGYFVCANEELIACLRTHIESVAPDDMKATLMNRLQHTVDNGPRRLPPGAEELAKAEEGNFETKIDVFVLTRNQTVTIDTSTVCADCVGEIAKQMLMPEFGLTIAACPQFDESGNVLSDGESTARETLILPREKILDVLSRFESEHGKRTFEYAPPRLILRKAAVGLSEQLDDPRLTELVYQHVLLAMSRPDFSCSVEDATEIFALRYQMVYTPKDPPNLTELLEGYLSEKLLVMKSILEWENLVRAHHLTITKMSVEEAQYNVISVALRWPLVFAFRYKAVPVGDAIQFVWEKTPYKKPDVEIAIDYAGVHFADPHQKVLLRSMPFFDIVEFGGNQDYFELESNGVKYEFQTSYAADLRHSMDQTIQNLAPESKYALAIEDNDIDENEPDALAFRKDDLLLILERNTATGWWKGKTHGRVGWFSGDLVAPAVLRPRKLDDKLKKRRAKDSQAKELKESQEDAVDKAADQPELLEQQYSMLNFARVHFREISQGEAGSSTTAKKKKASEGGSDIGWNELVKLIKYVKQPITESLTRIYTEEDQNKAVEYFKCVMRFMGDFASKQTPLEAAQMIIQAGIDKLTIRDEIFCQIIKQTTSNRSKKSDSCARGWQLLLMCVGCFPPSPTFDPYLRKHLQTYSLNKSHEFADIAAACEKRLYAVKKWGPRKYVPSPEEFSKFDQATSIIKVIFPDGTKKAMEIWSMSTGKDITHAICKRMDLPNPDNFGLYVGYREDEYMVNEKEYLADRLCYIRNLYEQELPAYGEKVVGEIRLEYEYTFRKFLWPKDEDLDLKQNPSLCNIIFHQILLQCRAGYFRTTSEDVVEIGAILAKVNESSYDRSNPAIKEAFYRQFLVSSEEIAIGEWVKKVDEELEKMKNADINECKRHFVTKVQKWPMYGTEFFVIDKPKTDRATLPDVALLTINHEGIKFISQDKRIPLIAFSYQDISSWRFGPEQINMKIGGLVQRVQRNLRGFTPMGQEICHQISMYVAILAKNMQTKKPVAMI